MTLHEFRNLVLSLKGLVTDPDDRHALEQAIKNVAEYRTITQVDSETVFRLVTKYTTAT